MLDFSADASEGPIRAYLLDVADTEEQDMALNIHAFSAGRTWMYEHPHTGQPRGPVLISAVQEIRLCYCICSCFLV